MAEGKGKKHCHNDNHEDDGEHHPPVGLCKREKEGRKWGSVREGWITKPGLILSHSQTITHIHAHTHIHPPYKTNKQTEKKKTQKNKNTRKCMCQLREFLSFFTLIHTLTQYTFLLPSSFEPPPPPPAAEALVGEPVGVGGASVGSGVGFLPAVGAFVLPAGVGAPGVGAFVFAPPGVGAFVLSPAGVGGSLGL